MLISLLQRYYLWVFIVLSGLSGLALGQLGATAVGIFVAPRPAPEQLRLPPINQATPRTSLSDYQAILERDIFNSAGGRQKLTSVEPTLPATTTPAKVASKWTLVGTISGGESPLATLSSAGGETAAYRLNQELPDGAKLYAIKRKYVELRYPDGQSRILEITQDELKTRPSRSESPQRAQPVSTSGIESLGENRWLIPEQLAEDTRSNVGDLLKQAQAIPYLEGNQTTGFQIRMIQRGSFIEQLGLQKGDILREVNGVALNSPEKALQVFGQLRQAKQISIGLERRGKAMTFAYEIR